MPTVGEIKKGKDIGKTPRNYFLWGACPKCGKERWVQLLKSKDAMHRLCRNCGNLGHPAYNWKGGRTKDDRGYIRISTNPKDFFYPMASSIKDGYGYIFEHRLVMAKHLGRCLQSWELVHHKGIRYTGRENKSDNLIDNLKLTTRGSHITEHNKGYMDGYRQGYQDAQSKVIGELKAEIKLLHWQLNEKNNVIQNH